MSLKEDNDKLNRQLVSLQTLLESKDLLLKQLQKQLQLAIEQPIGQQQRMLNTLDHSIRKNIKLEYDYSLMSYHFEEVHPKFYKKLGELEEVLTAKDMRLAGLIKMQLSNKEIAHLSNISHAGVKKAIQRLRKKLNLGPDDDLRSLIEAL